MNRCNKKNILTFVSNNSIVIVYGILSFSIEVISLLFFDCSPFIFQPLYSTLLWLTSISIIVLFKNRRLQAIYSSFILILQIIIILGNNYLFLSNGTVFERSMLKQRNDAYATIEQFYLSPGLVYICSIVIICYIVFLILKLRKHKGEYNLLGKYNWKFKFISIVIPISIVLSFTYYNFIMDRSSDSYMYKEILYDSGNTYQEKGITGNFIYEILKGNKQNIEVSDLSELEKDIYAKRTETSNYNGVSKDNNLIMILAESFEWFPLEIYNQEQTAKIYPNLGKLISESVICNNFYSREKTDTAESLMIVGSNPTGKYIHSDFYDNSFPYSLPNLYRAQAIEDGVEDLAIRSFHQNKSSFYNRNNAHLSFGFDDLVGIDEMKDFGVVNTWDDSKLHERTLDSLTMDAMKNEMFPSNRRFFSFWITFTTHGFYNERESLQEYYDKFDKIGVFPKGDKNQNYLRTYAATIADFDKAIGIMMKDLESKDLLDNTTIAVIADHNAYYNKLSNYSKKIDTQFNPELYRVPFIIYDKKLTSVITESGNSKNISKFTTTSDIIPTMVDLLGIDAWDNLYLGSTIFSNRESIIYSRAYNIFINNRLMGFSLNNLKYVEPVNKQEIKSDFETKALLYLKKLYNINKIIYSDYFLNHSYKP